MRLMFFTSNIVKLAHARHVAEKYDLEVIGFRQHTYRADYQEPRHVPRKEMLEQSYNSALDQFEKSGFDPKTSFFFLEDTSVRIEALSEGGDDFPGLDIKFWIKEIDFRELDQQLRSRRNDRRVVVRSDVLLHVPEMFAGRLGTVKRHCVFVGTQEGIVVESEVAFEQNLLFPWLDNKTFNKWFQPVGESLPLGALDIVRADAVDFRRESFGDMFSFLQTKLPQSRKVEQYGMNLEMDDNLILCGYTCAGKTTASQLLARRFGYLHIEASDFMYLSFFLRHGYRSDVSIGEFAEQALAQKPSIAADQILTYLRHEIAPPVVISGFRSLREVEHVMEQLAHTGKKFRLIFVEADEQRRFERLVARGRPGDNITYRKFANRDHQQERMGLSEVRGSSIAEVWRNQASLEDWRRFVEGNVVVTNPNPIEVEAAIEKVAARSVVRLEDAILIGLLSEWDDDERTRPYFTTTKIVRVINELFSNMEAKHKDNVSRYFNQSFHAYYEVTQTGRGDRRGFRLSNTGYGRSLQTLRRILHTV